MEDHVDDVLLVQYEEYVRNPQGVADRILEFFPGKKNRGNVPDGWNIQGFALRSCPVLTLDETPRWLAELESLDITVSKLDEKKTTLRSGGADRGAATGGENNAQLFQKYVTCVVTIA